MNKKTPLLIIAIIAVIGGVTAIATHKGSDNMKNTPASSTTPTSQTAQETNAVTIQSFAFGPNDIKVKAGTTVTWTNNDSVHHTVTADSGADGPKSKEFTKGETYTFTFNKAGTYSYHCEPHPYMHGKVTVI